LNWFYASSPGQSWEDILWSREEIFDRAADPSDLPPTRIFPDKGNMVFRTGWNDDDTVLVYRAGPNFNHTHADQGSFRLYSLGEHLVSEGTYGTYYSNPYYWSYFIQSAAHNVILIDDNPESQLFGDFANEVSAFTRYARI